MKFVVVPNQKDLQKAYEKLEWSKTVPTAKELVLWSHWARLDPRLAELIVQKMWQIFAIKNPLRIWRINSRAPQPQALMVILEFTLLLAKSKKRDEKEIKFFRLWKNIIALEVKSAPYQSFFVPMGLPRPKRELKTALNSLKPYSRWGYYGVENLIGTKNELPKTEYTMMGKAERLRILEQMMAKGRSFTVTDYIQACAGRVHRRTAERDLRGRARLRQTGKTRLRRYHPTASV